MMMMMMMMMCYDGPVCPALVPVWRRCWWRSTPTACSADGSARAASSCPSSSARFRICWTTRGVWCLCSLTRWSLSPPRGKRRRRGGVAHVSSTCHPRAIHITSTCYPCLIHVSSMLDPRVIPRVIHVPSTCYPRAIHMSSTCHPRVIRSFVHSFEFRGLIEVIHGDFYGQTLVGERRL